MSDRRVYIGFLRLGLLLPHCLSCHFTCWHQRSYKKKHCIVPWNPHQCEPNEMPHYLLMNGSTKGEEHKHLASGSQVNGNCYEKMNNATWQERNKKCIARNTNISLLSIQLSVVLSVVYTYCIRLHMPCKTILDWWLIKPVFVLYFKVIIYFLVRIVVW